MFVMPTRAVVEQPTPTSEGPTPTAGAVVSPVVNTRAGTVAAPATSSIVRVQYESVSDDACQATAPDASVNESCVSCQPASPMQGCPTPGCRGCQGCVVQPFGYANASPYYFNPNLLDPNEFICDGGDNAPAARAKAGDQIIGVDLEDTVVRYTTEAGDIHVQPSNKVCLYAPRFAAVRKVVGAEGGELAVGAIAMDRPQGPVRADLVQPGLALSGREPLGRGTAVRGPDAVRARDRSVPVELVIVPEVAEDVLAILGNLTYLNGGLIRDAEKPWISKAAIAAITWSIDEQVAVTVNDLAPATLTRDLDAEEMYVYDFPDAGRLRICKMADKSDALPGDTVTFMIRVDNVGDSSVDNVVITDNLVTRLEYVADTQKSSVKTDFETEANDGQSLRLTWKLAGPLKVGEGATIEFKCLVR